VNAAIPNEVPKVMPASEEELPQFLRKLLDACPTAGSGVNDWIFRVGRHLHAHMAEETMFVLLKEKSQGCGRVVKDAEIWRQIKCSRRSAWVPNNPRAFKHKHADELQNDIQIVPAGPAWPEPDLDLILRIVSGRFLLSDLRRMSPIKLRTEAPSHTEAIIDAIWPGNPLLCCGKNTYTFATPPWLSSIPGMPLHGMRRLAIIRIRSTLFARSYLLATRRQRLSSWHTHESLKATSGYRGGRFSIF
jgi:hypothetical protein